VLVVEDEDLVRKLAVALLERSGFTVMSAADGLEALDALKKAPVDLILSDVVMPRLGGEGLLRILREQGNETPVVFMSGNADGRLEREPLAQSCLLVSKPFSTSELLSALRRAQGPARPVPPPAA